MKLLTSEELARAVNLNIPGGNLIASAVLGYFRSAVPTQKPHRLFIKFIEFIELKVS